MLHHVKQVLALYRTGIPLSNLNLQSSFDWRCFRYIDVLSPVIVNWQMHKDVITNKAPDFLKYLYRHQNTWIFPIGADESHVTGFLLKGLDSKSYYRVELDNEVPAIYGLQFLHDVPYDAPVVIVEGVRDLAWFRKHYPYVIASLTSTVSSDAVRFLCYLGSNFRLAFDADKAGRNGVEKALALFSSHRARAIPMLPVLKDWGQYFEVPEMESTFSLQASQYGLDLTIGKEAEHQAEVVGVVQQSGQ